MGFEDNFLSNIDRNRRQERQERKNTVESSMRALIPREYADAQTYIKESAVRMGTFTDLYGPETVQRDIAEVERLKRIFSESGKQQYSEEYTYEDVRKLSEISESYILRGINQGGWIPHCSAIKTSDYDDYVNGTDLILEYRPRTDNPASHIGLGIDITFASSMKKKFKKIKEEIESNTLAQIKYFDSPLSHVRGQLRNVTRGVVGFDQETLNQLAYERTRYGTLRKDNPERLIMLHQLDAQFRTFTEYAQEIGSETAPHLERSSKFVHLLTDYVMKQAPEHDAILLKSHSVKNIARELEHFRDM